MKMKKFAKYFSLCMAGFISGSIVTSIGVIHLVKKSRNIQNGISLEIDGWFNRLLHKGEEDITGQTYPYIVFKARKDAKKVLDDMEEQLNKYGVVTIADFCLFSSDFCDLSSSPCTYLQNKYGWTNVDAHIVPVPDGYMIVFKNYPKEVL